MSVQLRSHVAHVAHGHAAPHPGHLVLLLPLHPTVAEPDLDLGLRHTQGVGDLDPGEEIYQTISRRRSTTKER